MRLAVLLHERACEIDSCQFLQRLFPRRLRQFRIESGQRRAQVAYQHHIAFARSTERAVRPERLFVKRIDALPAENTVQMIGKSFLHQPIFAVDVGNHAAAPPAVPRLGINSSISSTTCARVGSGVEFFHCSKYSDKESCPAGQRETFNDSIAARTGGLWSTRGTKELEAMFVRSLRYGSRRSSAWCF